MVKLSDLKSSLKTINAGYPLAMALYFYGNQAYSIIYDIMDPYRNYLNRSKTITYNQFNIIILCLYIEVEYGFAIYQNLWT